MPVNISIKNAPDDLVAALKARAQRNHRSLQGEVLAMLEEMAMRPLELTARERQREQAVASAISLMRQGLPIGGRRFTRDEMHER